VGAGAGELGKQFTCFTGTKVKKLTMTTLLDVLLEAHFKAQIYLIYCTSTASKLVQKYKN
jgi:hypothetical protein